MNTFKLAIRDNQHILKEQGIWGFPSGNGGYRAFIQNAVPKDQVIFTHKGDPVAVGVVKSSPTSKLIVKFPDGGTYKYIFTVDVVEQGHLDRKELREDRGIKLHKGVVTYQTNEEYTAIKTLLSGKKPRKPSIKGTGTRKSGKRTTTQKVAVTPSTW